MVLVLQFDEEFSARQEAQTELQKREEKIKELEIEIQQLRTQVMKKCISLSSKEEKYCCSLNDVTKIFHGIPKFCYIFSLDLIFNNRALLANMWGQLPK